MYLVQLFDLLMFDDAVLTNDVPIIKLIGLLLQKKHNKTFTSMEENQSLFGGDEKWREVDKTAVNEVLTKYRGKLTENKDETTAAAQMKYMKGAVRFYGLKTPLLKEVFSSFYSPSISSLPLAAQIFMAFKLLESETFEEKYTSILIFSKNLRTLNAQETLQDLAKALDSPRCVCEWATCDGIASRVIHYLIVKNAELAAQVASWKSSESIWRQRCACVSFVKMARFGGHNEIILDLCSTVVRRVERFAQLGVGWVLRELSLADLEAVVEFIKKNYGQFSREGLRYAIEKMSPSLKKKLLNYSVDDDSGEDEDVKDEEEEEEEIPVRRKRSTKK